MDFKSDLKTPTLSELMDYGSGKAKKKRVVLTPKQRLYVWEHPKLYGRTCNICHQRITKMSDMQLDHTHPYSKGGTKMNLAHRDCNSMKGSKSLRSVQTKMTFKKTPRTKNMVKKKKRKRDGGDIFGIGKIWKMQKYPKI